MVDDPYDDEWSPLKGSLVVHSEEELKRVASIAMKRCPHVVEMMRIGAEPLVADQRKAMSELNRAMQDALPEITLVEMAKVALFIALQVRPLTAEQKKELEAMRKRSKANVAALKTRRSQ